MFPQAVPTSNKIVKIDSEVPFGPNLYAWLTLNDLKLNKIIKHDQIEQRYLAWESVRKQTNPFFDEGTGFEGYLIGRCPDSEAALEAILAINQHILDAIARLYNFRYNFRIRLMQTLTRERYDAEALHIWSAQLGAELGKLRSQAYSNPAAEQFRNQTYKIVRNLPPMIYHESGRVVTQTYAVGTLSRSISKQHISLEMLQPSKQDAWLVATHIGEFGHPLVRKFLDHN